MSATPASAAGGEPRVLIVGAGFAGLAAAKALRRSPVQVTLVDQHNHHVFTPFLYQVATALLEPSEVAQPVRSLIRCGRAQATNPLQRAGQTAVLSTPRDPVRSDT